MKLMKPILAMAIATFSIQQTDAQIFLHDHMTHHSTMTDDLENLALHKDDGSNTYYVAQKIVPSEENAIVWSEMDENFDIIRTHRYVAQMFFSAGELIENTNFYITIKDINFTDENIYIVGRYIEEGVDFGAFMFCADKGSGAFKWFQKYTDIYILESVVCKDGMDGAVAVGHRGSLARMYQNKGLMYPVTDIAGVIVRADNSGTLMWQREIEDDKYMGHPDNVGSMLNRLYQVKQLNEDEFVAVGVVNDYLMGTFPYNDGDGAVITFDESGIITNKKALGNTMTVMTGGSQNLQHEIFNSVTVCSDGDVVMAGTVIDFPNTTFATVCPGGPTPQKAGIWVTKMNPSTGIVAWSKVYDWWTTPFDPHNFPQPFDVKVENDGSDNFGVVYLNIKEALFKVDINGNVIYSREYIYPSSAHSFKDISTGFGNTNIVLTGIINNGDAINVTAFDNKSGDCNEVDLPLAEYPHEYEVFDVEDQTRPRLSISVHFLEEPELIDNFIDCVKEEEEPEPELVRFGQDNNVTISQDVAAHNVLVQVTDGETYTGRLMNNMGQTIQVYNNVKQQYHIQIGDLAAGMYFLHLQNSNHSTTKMIQVQ